MENKTAAIWIIILILIIAGAYWIWQSGQKVDLQKTSTANVSQQQPNTNMTFDIQGMKVEVLQQGTGPEAKAGDTVKVDYVGTLENGTKFDSSIDRGQPFSFTLGENKVIKGWELGVAGMKVGEKRRLTIPSELAYGEQSVGGVIPSNSTLIFEVSLLGINQ